MAERASVKRDNPDDLREWQPYVHVDRACELARLVEDNNLSTPEGMANALALGQLHIAIANAKMTGRQRHER